MTLKSSKFAIFAKKCHVIAYFSKSITYFQNSFCKYVRSSLLTNSVQFQLYWSSGSAENLRARLK